VDGWASRSSGIPALATTMDACRCREAKGFYTEIERKFV
jgi:hypothetical protein